ncbi:MAG: hypothetical protein V7K92_27940 [Nostoc sp.]|uniref:hypothetical protein n=1 Tax=Nostoc sp. TaxID=1180 RepID=UPI002FEF22D4
MDFRFWIDLTDISICSVHQGIIGHQGSRKPLSLEVEPLSLEVAPLNLEVEPFSLEVEPLMLKIAFLKDLITKICFSCLEKSLISASYLPPCFPYSRIWDDR